MDDKAAPLKLVLFGSLQMVVNGTMVTHWHSNSVRCLTAYLTLHANRRIDRSFIAATLWPEPDSRTTGDRLRTTTADQRAQNSLRQALHHLRKALGDEAWRLEGYGKSALLFNLIGAEADVFQFDHAVASAEIASLESAVALYRGPFLQDCLCDGEWAETARRTRESQCADALYRLARHNAAERCLEKASDYLRRLITIEPYRESAYCMLMEIEAERRNCAEVTRAYQSLRALLRNDLNVEPDAATRTLYGEQLRRCTESAPLHSMTTKSPFPGNLPRQITSFVGRAAEIETTRKLLDQACLLTLTGPGGAGKSRLALQVGEKAGQEFEDGVWFIDLSPVSDADLAVRTVATTLALQVQPGADMERSLIGALQSRRMLLLLDNCEHLRDACSRLASVLVRQCPGVKILATSRESLGIVGEQIFRVEPMHLPPDHLSLKPEQIASYESVRLFAERAQLAGSNFVIGPSNADAIARICRRLDGLPLAIELAAVRTASISLRDMEDRLEQRFQLLADDRHGAYPRRQTLRAAIDWSFDLLSPSEQRLLVRLAVFSGGWTLDAAEKVVSDSELRSDEAISPFESAKACEGIDRKDVCDLLSALVDKSLVQVDQLEERGRYRFLETIRHYARERLSASDENRLVRRRHLLWCLDQATSADRLMRGPGQRDALERLEREHDNLRSALSWSEIDAGCAQTGIELTLALCWFWFLRDHFTEGRRNFERAIKHLVAAGSQEHRAQALLGAGMMAYASGDYPAAGTCLRESLAAYRNLGSAVGAAAVLNYLGLLAGCEGDYAASETHLKESAAIFRSACDDWGLQAALSELGFVVYLRGDLNSARLILEESLGIARRLADSWSIAGALRPLGFVMTALGDYAAGRTSFLESVALSRRLGDNGRVAQGLDGLAIGLFAEGNLHSAVRVWGAAESLARRIGVVQSNNFRERYEQSVARARILLGQSDFAQAWSAGCSQPWEATLASFSTPEEFV